MTLVVLYDIIDLVLIICFLCVCIQEVPRSEWNGEGFHYIVGYRRFDLREAQKKSEVRNASQTELVIHDLSAFVRYEFFVQSANDIGATPIRSNEKRTGYSGEGSRCSWKLLLMLNFENPYDLLLKCAK